MADKPLVVGRIETLTHERRIGPPYFTEVNSGTFLPWEEANKGSYGAFPGDLLKDFSDAHPETAALLFRKYRIHLHLADGTFVGIPDETGECWKCRAITLDNASKP